MMTGIRRQLTHWYGCKMRQLCSYPCCRRATRRQSPRCRRRRRPLDPWWRRPCVRGAAGARAPSRSPPSSTWGLATTRAWWRPQSRRPRVLNGLSKSRLFFLALGVMSLWCLFLLLFSASFLQQSSFQLCFVWTKCRRDSLLSTAKTASDSRSPDRQHWRPEKADPADESGLWQKRLERNDRNCRYMKKDRAIFNDLKFLLEKKKEI